MSELNHYAPLPDPRRWTRLIEIRPGAGNDLIECELTTHKLDDLPLYHAISYVWGSPPDTAWIVLNGERRQVRPKCLAALWQAKHHGGSRYHWIDSLCIDQDDIYEKSCQVEMMGEIFNRAEGVLSCIGDHGEGSEVVLQMLGTCPKRLLGAWPGDDFSIKAMLWVMSTSKAGLAMVSAGLQALLRREYFQRVWMLQEVFRKQLRVSVCCGVDHQPLSALFVLVCTFRLLVLAPDRPSRLGHRLAKAAKSLISRLSGNKLAAIDDGFSSRFHHSRAAALFLLYVSYPGRRRGERKGTFTKDDGRDGLTEILERVAHSRCQDPRDRVFATRMLVDWGLGEPIVPDYSMSNFDLALEVVQRFGNRGTHSLLFDVGRLAWSLSVTLQDEAIQEAIRSSSERSAGIERTAGFSLRSYDGWWGFCLGDNDVAALMSAQACPDCPIRVPANHGEMSGPQDPGSQRPYVIGDMRRGDWLLAGGCADGCCHTILLSRPQADGTATISGMVLFLDFANITNMFFDTDDITRGYVYSRTLTPFRIMLEHWVALTITILTNFAHECTGGMGEDEVEQPKPSFDEQAQRLVQRVGACIFNPESSPYAEEESSRLGTAQLSKLPDVS